MPIEKSAGAIIFREKSGKIFYLLLHYPSSSKTDKDYWDLPKGKIEKEEKIEETARREIREETGIEDVEFIPGFKETIKYFYKSKRKTVFKTVTFLLAKTKQKEVKISWEHIGYKWLPYEEALEQITFKNAKDILMKANTFLNSKIKEKNA